jgi:hypothetical protein
MLSLHFIVIFSWLLKSMLTDLKFIVEKMLHSSLNQTYYQFFFADGGRLDGRWSSSQCAQRAITEAKQRS